MRRVPSSVIQPGHPDFELLSEIAAEIRQRVPQRLDAALADCCLEAVEFVLDPVRTGRTTLAELDNVEKTFVGLKVEHVIRDMLDAPKGVRDLELAGYDVDVKNTVGHSWCWMIPPETFVPEEPCILVAVSEKERRSWMGLIIARPDYLGAANRDGKRRINSRSFSNILWLAEGVEWPPNRWAGIDMVRFRELRQMDVAGAQRAALFFAENLRRPTHRKVLEALLHDQRDPMKRLRGNNGAKDVLRPQNIALLSGLYFNNTLARLGLPRIAKDEFIAVDVQTDAERDLLRAAEQMD